MFKINLGDILRIIMLFGCTFAPLKAVTTGKDIMGIISVSPDQIPSAEISLEKLKAEIQVYYNNNKLPENFCLDETIANVKMKFSSQDMPENIRLLGHGETGSATMYIIGSDDADSNNSIASNPSTETFWREASEEAQNKPPELEVVNPAPDAATTTLGVIPTVTQFIPEKAPKEAPETLAPIQTSVSPEKAPELTPEGPTPIQAPVSPETTPEPKPETTPEPKPEIISEPKPEIISEPKPETTPEPKPEITPKTLEGIQNNIKGSSNIKGNPPNSINAAPKNPTSKSESPAQNNSTDPVKNSNTSNNALSINIATGNPGKDAKDIFSGPRLEDENSLGTPDSINNEKESQVQSEKNENKKIEDEEEEEEQKERDDEEEEEEEDEGEKGGDGQEQSDDDDDDDDEDDDDEEDNK